MPKAAKKIEKVDSNEFIKGMFPKRRIEVPGNDGKTYTIVVTMPSWGDAPDVFGIIERAMSLIDEGKFTEISKIIAEELMSMIDKCTTLEGLDQKVSIRDLPQNITLDVIFFFDIFNV